MISLCFKNVFGARYFNNICNKIQYALNVIENILTCQEEKNDNFFNARNIRQFLRYVIILFMDRAREIKIRPCHGRVRNR